MHLPGRDEFFGFYGIKGKERIGYLNRIINNIFFHIEKVNGEYPVRWFTAKVLAKFREQVVADWETRYGDKVLGFETLVELPRRGECYLKDKWTLTGQTKGFTCKRVAGESNEIWSGKRVWNKDEENLRPKLVLCRRVEEVQSN